MNLESNGEVSNDFFKRLNQQIVQKNNLIKLLQLQIKNLRAEIDSGEIDDESIEQLKKALEEKAGEVENLLNELNAQKEQYSVLEQQKDEQIKTLSQMLEEQQNSEGATTEVIEDSRVSELETTIVALHEELEKEKQSALQIQELNKEVDIRVPELETTIVALHEELEKEKQNALQIQELNKEAEIRVPELEATIATLYEELEKEKQNALQIQELNKEIDSLRSEIDSSVHTSDHNDISELETLNSSHLNKIQELEQDVINLKKLLDEKQETDGNAADLFELEESRARITKLEESLQTSATESDKRIAELEESLQTPVIEPDELEQLRQDSSLLIEISDELTILKQQSESFSEATTQIVALKSERDQLIIELEQIKTEDNSIHLKEIDDSKIEIGCLKELIKQRENELARVRVALETREDESINDLAIREEIEQLTQQIADQLLAIQSFEDILNKTRQDLEEKTIEVETLRDRKLVSETNTGDLSGAVIPVDDSENSIISSFIDFFDGLDSIIAKNPIPELQNLHQKLLERLILPNKISYMSVVAEEYDPHLHFATDYFRSSKFPEKCIVFEVEKGYKKGELVIKKSKVWVIQNLFACASCNAVQSSSESLFCHLCGSKIVAPNGLPIDSLPEFEPTPITYQRFADSVMCRGEVEKARDYLRAALDLDAEFIPSMVSLAEIIAADSKYSEAIDLLNRANAVKPDDKIKSRIEDFEVKQNILKQAQTLNLPQEELDKLLNLIQTKQEN